MDYIADLHELCETISNEIADANEKIRAAGGKLTSGDVDYIDKLTHTMKSVKAVIAMMEDEDGYSNRGSYRSYPGGSYRGGSYRNRDSMGRYSGRGYSRGDGFADELRELMEEAPNEQTRQQIQRLLSKMER